MNIEYTAVDILKLNSCAVSSKKTISKSNSLKTKSNSPKTNEKKKVVKTPGSFGNVLNKILKQEVNESKTILAKSSVIKEVTEQKEPSHIEKVSSH